MKFSKIKGFFWVSIFRSIYINFRLLPFKDAIKFPIIVSRSTTIDSLSGTIKISCKVNFGMIRIGFIHSDIISWNEIKNFLKIEGKWIINGVTNLGVGSKIVIYKNATLVTGNNFASGSNLRIICSDKIEINDNFRAAWDVQIMDSNFHYVKNINSGKVNRKNSPIRIGENNWIGNRSSIMSGTITPNFFIVASNSVCNKNYINVYPSFSLIGGIPAKLIKSDIYRVLDYEEKEINKLFEDNELTEVFIEKTPRARF